VRAVFAIAGLAALAWGAWLAVELLASGHVLSAAAWFVGGVVLHDGLIAPLAGVVGVLIARRLPAPWRAPVAAGGVLSGVLLLLAIPLLWQPFGAPANPGLHDGDYLTGLLVSFGTVWLGVVAIGIVKSRTRAGEG
jgi:hypothetical protein